MLKARLAILLGAARHNEANACLTELIHASDNPNLCLSATRMAAVATGFSPASVAVFGLMCERFPSDEQHLTIKIELVVGLLGQTGLTTNGGWVGWGGPGGGGGRGSPITTRLLLAPLAGGSKQLSLQAMSVLDELLLDHEQSRRTLKSVHLHVLLQQVGRPRSMAVVSWHSLQIPPLTQVVKATNLAKQSGDNDFVLQWGDRVLKVQNRGRGRAETTRTTSSAGGVCHTVAAYTRCTLVPHLGRSPVLY